LDNLIQYRVIAWHRVTGGTTVSLSSLSLALLLAAPGDPATGRQLFIGARPFQGGGAPCGSCHALGGEGPAFAASFGPELSGSLDGMEPEALDGLLTDLPFPSMTPIYDGHALTPAERSDLGAFLTAAVKQGPPAADWRFEALGLLGALAAFLLIALAGKGRKTSSRVRLLHRARLSSGGSR
jgi:mono/diheme cytochrome c family protein